MLTVISVWRDEELLAPFFLSHYSFVNRIIILLDTATTDQTRNVLESDKKVEIRDIAFPNKFDDCIKINAINSCYREISEGWVLVADADEFLLEQEFDPQFDVYFSEFAEVYRHEADLDLDPLMPAVLQRVHGIWQKDNNPHGFQTGKPNIAKAGLDVGWGVGHHSIGGEFSPVCGEARVLHWQMADPIIMVARHLNRHNLLSPENIQRGHGVHWAYFQQPGYINRIFEAHKNDPKCI